MSSSNERHHFLPALSGLVLVVVIATLLAACVGVKTSGQSQSSDSAEFALTIIARTAPGAPEGYGVDPGDLAVDASVSAENIDFLGSQAAAGITNESGRVVLMLKSGKYNVSILLKTHDPLCSWFGSTEIEVVGKISTVSVDDLWIVCE